MAPFHITQHALANTTRMSALYALTKSVREAVLVGMLALCVVYSRGTSRFILAAHLVTA